MRRSSQSRCVRRWSHGAASCKACESFQPPRHLDWLSQVPPLINTATHSICLLILALCAGQDSQKVVSGERHAEMTNLRGVPKKDHENYRLCWVIKRLAIY